MDTKKVLLGSTAIVGAGVLLANPSPAHAQLEVILSGFTEFGVIAAEDDAIALDREEEDEPGENVGDRGYDFFMDNEIIVRAEGVNDATGIAYGSKVEVEVGTGTLGGETVTDEVLFFAAGAFGRIELGREDGAADVMFLGAETIAAGTGGNDGDLPINLTGGNILDSGDAEKVTYFTPRVGGFQAGVSYTPNTGEDPEDVEITDPDEALENVEDFFEAGVNFIGEFAGLDVGLAAVGTYGDEIPFDPGAGFADEDENTLSYGVGGTVGFAGLNFGAAYGHDEVADAELDFISAGVAFGLGPANASLIYEYNDPDIDIDFDDDDDDDDGPDDNAHLVVLSADVGLLPGVILKGDLGYGTEDLTLSDAFEREEEGEPDGDTLAGVVTVQINY